jgi:hypothetical protein
MSNKNKFADVGEGLLPQLFSACVYISKIPIENAMH